MGEALPATITIPRSPRYERSVGTLAFTDADVAEALRLAAMGVPQARIAQRLRCGAWHVRELLRRSEV